MSHFAPHYPLGIITQTGEHDEIWLKNDEWRRLAGCAFAHRAMESTFAALMRLLTISRLPLPALRLLDAYPQSPERGVAQFSLSGERMLLQRWREETAHALADLDTVVCPHWQRWTQPGGLPGE
ncbi:MAG: tRNA-binding protein [Candidatus Malihini olakiniferum]